ncbi:hypothetical protein [Streptomyces sp. S.PB5]|uniref:hypothetical protein n=1 Tax=Streptomyces sp. S.PB5 TaxID=3020844 RepID=UPI0025AF9D5E|nr:hypothetical protein [Streptomyces sp. S.PB5]MDN3027473.1 hypothetical protein [Streptomyces sp. S.PB5]
MTIVVTHQLENTRLADHILVMDQGRVVERGTYEELVSAGDSSLISSPSAKTAEPATPRRDGIPVTDPTEAWATQGPVDRTRQRRRQHDSSGKVLAGRAPWRPLRTWNTYSYRRVPGIHAISLCS